ncbi:MAG: hypothetical protein WBA74_17000 [Cyclobacteriaceae bacterium]
MTSQIEILYQEYHKNRNVHLSLEQFIYIASLFPSLLVCMADGKLDNEEWEGVLSITDGLAQNYAGENFSVDEEELAQMFRIEFRYLLDNLDKWDKKFLNALKSHIEDNQSAKEFIHETMYLLANIADGISPTEQQTIDDLSKRLSLDH